MLNAFEGDDCYGRLGRTFSMLARPLTTSPIPRPVGRRVPTPPLNYADEIFLPPIFTHAENISGWSSSTMFEPMSNRDPTLRRGSILTTVEVNEWRKICPKGRGLLTSDRNSDSETLVGAGYSSA